MLNVYGLHVWVVFFRTYFWCRLLFSKQNWHHNKTTIPRKRHKNKTKNAIVCQKKKNKKLVDVYVCNCWNLKLNNSKSSIWKSVPVAMSQWLRVFFLSLFRFNSLASFVSTENISCVLPLWFDGIVPNIIIFKLRFFVAVSCFVQISYNQYTWNNDRQKHLQWAVVCSVVFVFFSLCSYFIHCVWHVVNIINRTTK